MKLELRAASRRQGDETLLSQASLALEAASGLVVLGAEGAGKTVLLRLLALLDRPDLGRVLADGEDAWPRRRQLRHRLAFVRDLPVFLTGTAADELHLALALRGRRGAEAADDALHTLDRVGLTQRYWSGTRSLSAGEARLLDLARALVVDPEVLVADDLDRDLDARSLARALEVLESHRARGRTVVFALRDAALAPPAMPAVFLVRGQMAGPEPAEAFVRRRGLRRLDPGPRLDPGRGPDPGPGPGLDPQST